MSHIPENLEIPRKCTSYLAEIIIFTLFNKLPEDDVTAPKYVRAFVMYILILCLRQTLLL